MFVLKSQSRHEVARTDEMNRRGIKKLPRPNKKFYTQIEITIDYKPQSCVWMHGGIDTPRRKEN